jgi:hypothetical protein
MCRARVTDRLEHMITVENLTKRYGAAGQMTGQHWPSSPPP